MNVIGLAREKLAGLGPERQLSPVEAMFKKVDRRFWGVPQDDFDARLWTYLNAALRSGLKGQSIADSCVDLAITQTSDRWVEAIRIEKQAAWDSLRTAALSVERQPREVSMHLYPLYFATILEQRKLFEGRAFNPAASKNYPDIRRGDTIRFAIDDELPNYETEAAAFGLQPDMVMRCKVEGVYFAPTVHGVYQLPGVDGHKFQPTLPDRTGVHLEHAALYYEFPGYPELISEHGFLSIHVSNAQLVDS